MRSAQRQRITLRQAVRRRVADSDDELRFKSPGSSSRYRLSPTLRAGQAAEKCWRSIGTAPIGHKLRIRGHQEQLLADAGMPTAPLNAATAIVATANAATPNAATLAWSVEKRQCAESRQRKAGNGKPATESRPVRQPGETASSLHPPSSRRWLHHFGKKRAG
jgi:hypothetical protein